MAGKTIAQLVLLLLIAGMIVPLALIVPAPAPVYALRDPCALDPNNLVYNGSMGPQHGTQYGSAADGWEPFIFGGTPPQFRWVDNEQIDPNGSQQIYSGNAFDAGVQQTIKNLEPGVYYWVRWGYALAAKSYDGPNVRVDSIGRQIGVDPTGGSDPHSSNVIWNNTVWDGRGALNLGDMTLVFAARAPNATVYLRAIAKDGSSGENRVWMDAICMEAKRDMPTATPLPPTTAPTATPPPPTVPPTKVAAVRSPTPAVTRTRTLTPTPLPPTLTPTPVGTATPVPTPRYARPIATPAPEGVIGLNQGTLTGVGLGSILGSFVFFAFGIVLARRPN